MTTSRSAHLKKQSFRFLLAFSLVLSLFSVSGSVGLSSSQPQKTSTEFLWTERQHTLSRSVAYSSKQAPAILSWSPNWTKLIEQKAILIHDEVLLARFNQLARQFKAIKPEIMAVCDFKRCLIYIDELTIA